MAAGQVSVRQDFTLDHAPASATQATISKAAVAGMVWHCTAILLTFAAAGTAAAPIAWTLRDGASGAGTVLLSGTLSAVINTTAVVALSGLDIEGTVNTAMTLEFAGAGATATLQNVNLMGYGEQVG